MRWAEAGEALLVFAVAPSLATKMNELATMHKKNGSNQ
jgi:hypothetical protein